MAIVVLVNARGLLTILARRNKTQSWLAREVQITDKHLSEMIAGRTSPSGDVRDRMMKVLSVSSEKWDAIFRIENNYER